MASRACWGDTDQHEIYGRQFKVTNPYTLQFYVWKLSHTRKMALMQDESLRPPLRQQSPGNNLKARQWGPADYIWHLHIMMYFALLRRLRKHFTN